MASEFGYSRRHVDGLGKAVFLQQALKCGIMVAAGADGGQHAGKDAQLRKSRMLLVKPSGDMVGSAFQE